MKLKNIQIDEEIHDKLKAYTKSHGGMNIYLLATEILKEWLEKHADTRKN